jgi:hypothetical protein
MGDTERLAALSKVRVARNAVQAARANDGLSPDAQSGLTKLYFDLDDLEDLLILEDITDKLATIQNDAADLKQSVAAMGGAADKLAKELSLVDDAAKAIGGLAKVVALAASHGLIS